LLQQHIKFSLVEFHHAISQNDLSDDALAGMNYFQLIFLVKKIRLSLTTSKEGLKTITYITKQQVFNSNSGKSRIRLNLNKIPKPRSFLFLNLFPNQVVLKVSGNISIVIQPSSSTIARKCPRSNQI